MVEYTFKGETLERFNELKEYLETVKWDEAEATLPPNPHLVCMCNDCPHDEPLKVQTEVRNGLNLGVHRCLEQILPVLFEGLEDEGYLRYSLGSSCDCLPCKCAACTISTPTKELLTMFIANLIFFRIMPS